MKRMKVLVACVLCVLALSSCAAQATEFAATVQEVYENSLLVRAEEDVVSHTDAGERVLILQAGGLAIVPGKDASLAPGDAVTVTLAGDVQETDPLGMPGAAVRRR